ncbi:g9975 [Coccomyxa viridis]|uniref:G9975 protein n=1 Tax=Coccomyxa viridis TaxID=1274662 RepID=A0ABP1G4D0_9CHLO
MGDYLYTWQHQRASVTSLNYLLSTNGTTPLHLAAEFGGAEAVQLLIRCGAEVNAGRSNGQTALFEAAFAGCIDAAKALLQHGADPGKLFGLEYPYLLNGADLFKNPVMAADGVNYSRAAIEQWLVRHDTSPATGARLKSKELYPNHEKREAVSIWRVATGHSGR